jgi:hypothetical protein
LTLALAGTKTTVDVKATAAILEVDPSAHVDADHSRIAKIPAFDPRDSLSQAITYSTALHSFSSRYEAPLLQLGAALASAPKSLSFRLAPKLDTIQQHWRPL